MNFEKALLGGTIMLIAAGGIAVAENDARKDANEAGAIGALRTINTQEVLFRDGDKENDGNNDFGMLSELSNTGLIDSVLGSGTKQGYYFTAAYSTTTSEYLWFGTASPTVPGKTGDRYFVVNADGVIYYSSSPITVDPKTTELPKGLTPVGADDPAMAEARKDRERKKEMGILGEIQDTLGIVTNDPDFWTDVSAGQVYTWKIVDRHDEAIAKLTIISKTEDSVTYEMAIGDGHGQPDVEKGVLPLKTETPFHGKFEELDRKEVGSESITVSGVTFDCQIIELSEKEHDGKSGKCWMAPGFPALVKAEGYRGTEVEGSIELIDIQGAHWDKALATQCACGAKFVPGSRYCNQCGKKRPKADGSSMTYTTCPACGAKYEADAKFCGKCGRARD